MAEIAVKKAEDKSEKALSRSGFWDPFSSWPSPSEFFSSNPFALMRRLSDEMDRAFSRFFHREGEESFWSPAIEVVERYGQFYRAIPLPEGANTGQAKAQFKNGVLEVSLPVPEQKSNRREIPIET